jgi:hypothetical protein
VGSTRCRALPHSSEATKGSQHITTINYNRWIVPEAGFCSGAIIMMKRLIHMIFWRIEEIKVPGTDVGGCLETMMVGK